MSTLLTDIKSNDWQISTLGMGVIAEGLQDIRQCLDIILRTVKGSDPLRPEFGSDIYQYVDTPSNSGIPNMVQAIIEAVGLWEPRVQVQTVKWQFDVSHVTFFITYKLVDQELIDLLKLYIVAGVISVTDAEQGSLILQAFFPPGYASKTLQISFIGDDNDVLPDPPENGFGSMDDLFNWVVSNWSAYGTWYKTSDRIVLYLRPGIFNSVSLQITATTIKRFAQIIPSPGIGQDFQVFFTPGSESVLESSTLISLEDMLAYAQTNWGDFGTWAIEPGSTTSGDFDDTDFDEDEFDTGSFGYVLVLYSPILDTAIIDIHLV